MAGGTVTAAKWVAFQFEGLDEHWLTPGSHAPPQPIGALTPFTLNDGAEYGTGANRVNPHNAVASNAGRGY
ncbi:MAG: hypothetical protein JXR37_28445 [Kiritimatiellae bacterium]|nr:hypothetical protein [Kiritimatiellia bacterium]